MEQWSEAQITIVAALVTGAVMGTFKIWVRHRPVARPEAGGRSTAAATAVIVFLLAGLGLSRAVDPPGSNRGAAPTELVSDGCVGDLMSGEGLSHDEAWAACEELGDPGVLSGE